MHRFVILLLFTVVLFFSFIQAQEASPGPGYGKIGGGIMLSWYHPSVSDLNTLFAGMEQANGLEPWNDFSVGYLGNASFSWTAMNKHQWMLQYQASYANRSRLDISAFDKGIDRDLHSRFLIQSLGVQYRYLFTGEEQRTFVPFLGAGAGWLLANFSRTYQGGAGISFSHDGFSGDVAAGTKIYMMGSSGLEAEARYLFVPAMTLANTDTKLSLSAFTIGIGAFIQM